MKYLIILLLALPSTAFGMDRFDYSRHDHKKHFAVSAALTFAGSHILSKGMGMTKTESIVAASALTFIAGVLKESSDSRAESGDIQGNMLGIGVGAIGAVLTIEF